MRLGGSIYQPRPAEPKKVAPRKPAPAVLPTCPNCGLHSFLGRICRNCEDKAEEDLWKEAVIHIRHLDRMVIRCTDGGPPLVYTVPKTRRRR